LGWFHSLVALLLLGGLVVLALALTLAAGRPLLGVDGRRRGGDREGHQSAEGDGKIAAHETSGSR
jgi:hypothetical protein